MRDLRCQIFEHMESLPIKYFDTHPHGDIMSVYTNDIDTLRQMISQSIPQLFNSGITIIAVLVSMFTLSIPLTILTLIMVGVMLFVTKQLASRSGRFFAKQQADLGATNGYIEEMMNGQKVVKVFNHEKRALKNSMSLMTGFSTVHTTQTSLQISLCQLTHKSVTSAMYFVQS